MLRKIGVYIIILIGGLFLGYLFFGTSKEFPIVEDQVFVGNQGKWTCAMHPKVEKESEGTCPLCSMALVYLAGSDSVLSESQFEMTDHALALANIQTTTIGWNNSEKETIRLSGKIITNQKTNAIQTSLYNGRIEKLFANFVGQKVYKGQKIGLIYAPELYLAQDKLLGLISHRETHRSLYDAARNTTGLWKMTDAQIDTMIAKGKPMFNFPIYADVSGTIIEVLAKEGDFYTQGQPLFRTSDLRTVWAVFDAYEHQLDEIREGEEVQISVKGINQKRIEAKISFVEPIMDALKRTVSVRAVLENKEGKLRPGMFADAIFSRKSIDNKMIQIPRSAVLWTGKRSVIYKKPYPNKPIFEMTEIELGRRLGDYYEVMNGLNVGDVVVAEGAFTIDAAAELKGKKSMMSNNSN